MVAWTPYSPTRLSPEIAGVEGGARQGEREGPRNEGCWYKTRAIRFFGQDVRIVLQNDNGPCPLIAICNYLLLMNLITLNPREEEVSESRLLSLIAERLPSASRESNEGDFENQKKKTTEASDLLSGLATGIIVNIKFNRIDDFEPAPELGIFELLNTPLYHGWIVDPKDFRTANAIGSKSYDELTTDLVELKTRYLGSRGSISEQGRPGEEGVEVITELLRFLGLSAAEDNNEEHLDNSNLGRGDLEEQVQLFTALQKSASSTTGEITADADKGRVYIQDNILNRSGEMSPCSVYGFSTSSDSEALYGDTECITSSEDDTVLVEHKDEKNKIPDEPGALDSSNAMTADGLALYRGLLAWKFLTDNASQLTVYGLQRLRNEIREGQLCILFRNNHFSNMLKFQGEVYLLVTDQGYLHQPDLVWEKLTEAKGNNVFVNGDFEEFTTKSNRTRGIDADSPWDEDDAVSKTQEFLDSIDDAKGMGLLDIDPDLQFAMSLGRQELESRM